MHETIDLILASKLWTSFTSRAHLEARLRVCAKQPKWIGIPAVCAAIFMFDALSVVKYTTLHDRSCCAANSTVLKCTPVWDSHSSRVYMTLEQSSMSDFMKCAVIVT